MEAASVSVDDQLQSTNISQVAITPLTTELILDTLLPESTMSPDHRITGTQSNLETQPNHHANDPRNQHQHTQAFSISTLPPPQTPPTPLSVSTAHPPTPVSSANIGSIPSTLLPSNVLPIGEPNNTNSPVTAYLNTINLDTHDLPDVPLLELQTEPPQPTPRAQTTNAMPIDAPLPDMPATSTLANEDAASWMNWIERKLNVAKQALSEKFGGTEATADPELAEKVDQLMMTQAAYRNILRLAISFNDHLYGMMQTQKELSLCFGELAVRQPELITEFTMNQESQKSLHRNGEALLGALQFFTDNLSTMVFTTMEDTLGSWQKYQAERLEYDAEKSALQHLRQVCKVPKRLEDAEQQFREKTKMFERAHDLVNAKLDLLGANKERVMQKQLQLYYEAMVAYFSGNQTELTKLLSKAHISPVHSTSAAATNSWLESMHKEVGNIIAPQQRWSFEARR
eukprot:m.13265 g.13265  ORF g.13265 m.13265 type:complete len:457 (-) comp9663_c0_seq1:90-1460(-)